ncbi:xanthine dehydrogenase accessory protein XdhC [Vreelandella populi]|uniref:Xanthine dehydrogenase accessory protein XdhC n=1 Tax=Vreelandella populi TaxID=2498858 RepID=A0A433LHH1_9GAMM|nr:xanthine dehydrogenase accessory protein XdhC [Halomonas populi]RUR37418.1 xanthine dehydrogenase accessory protein XdhC [Halomonas populi]RUR50416.1 xanthine dehydrogenase accessory protein XdhC [Halomonas populi]RUR56876.1 xanthine dehydrogenase accessory protein XdhC [Halomonas populi]
MSVCETWHGALHRLQNEGEAHVLATQVTSQGSTPREPGARMVITLTECFDTLGGGTFEWQTIAAARSLLQARQYGFHVEAFSLGGRSGQCCGGYLNVLLEAFPGSSANIAVFGAGHIGRELISLCAPLPWNVQWYDSRAGVFDEHFKRQVRLTCHSPYELQSSVATLPPNTHALVLTHSHDEDYALIAALIERDDVASIGLIGSVSKWASFEGRLKREGYSDQQTARVRSPIGLVHGAKLTDKTPYAIALTVVSELLWLTDTPSSQENRGLDPHVLRTLMTDSTTTTS